MPFDQKTLVLALEMLTFSLVFYELCSITMTIVPKFPFMQGEPGLTHFISGTAVDGIVIALQLTIMSWLYVTMLWKGKKI